MDEQLRSVVKRIEGEFTLGSPLPYEPALVEPLLGDVAALLDRCAAYQREASELEIKWVQHQLESQLASKLSELDLDLALASTGLASATAARVAHAATQAEFSRASDNALASGFAKEAEGASSIAGKAVDTAGLRESLLKERTNQVRDYQDKLDARHTEPGGAHNYFERYERIATLMFEDFEEAYRKAKCAVIGLRAIFGLDAADVQIGDLTAATPAGPVFSLILWARRMMRRIESFAETEVEYELVVPLLQPIQDAGKGLMNQDEYNAAMKDGGSGTLNFKLPADFFQNQSRLRLKGIGVSFTGPDLDKANTTAGRALVAVFPPLQELVQGQQRRRPPVLLGGVLPFGAHMAVLRSEGLAVHNLKPAGDWRIVVHPFLLTKDATAAKRSYTILTDLRLHLSLVAAPQADPGQWKAFV
ncbi:MAG TPA: hypothetical protein VLQ45_11340 [Thermoanaerobaculia bacterium]|nr:hypothetical protein [Thermoanaerobaculia bacterium]